MKETINKDTIKPCRAVNIAKSALSIAGKILVEIIEQQEDLNFMYFHGPGRGESVRSARYEHEAYQERREIRARQQAIRRLRANKMIKLRKIGDKVVYVLTTSGKVKALHILMLRSAKSLPNENICLVSFDFPEAARSARNGFRRFLKRSGFIFVQGSVWSVKNDVRPYMYELLKILKIDRWVKIYMATK